MSNPTPKPIAWCWQDKASLRRIRDAFDRTNDVCSALAVYLALTEISSDSNAPEFQTTHAWIARMAGVSVSTVQRRIKVLVDIGLLEVKTPDLRAPSTYKLLSFGNGARTLRNGARTFGHSPKRVPLPTSEECTEESKKNLPQNGSEADDLKLLLEAQR
ncbi:MAG: hypothetical protein AB9869_04680 [Verrucomicrobiia bacterium]